MPTYELIISRDISEGRRRLAAMAGMDTPLTLDVAVWAPECAGPCGLPHFTLLELRGAIRRGELRPERHGRNLFVTRRHLIEWREACREPQRAPGSGSSQPSTTRPPASSGRSRSGGSGTETSSSSLAALQRTAQALKKR
ncbi:conserved hypothetical protein, putative excisionase [Methylorubrum extorquens AM1]|uniref:Helix-turn-helix domain-containing protein n=1 Tax=Methylorubrum extorquens (strain ATCC 14718 / DSM 1338 / JCM 2805 / NCIMB 9133 / AM1) TaxID=272630 RepID=C5AZT6_METEA|nr:conserved hypothetical protein, putative excisionase [Methylorubrum extorquens AM1]